MPDAGKNGGPPDPGTTARGPGRDRYEDRRAPYALAPVRRRAAPAVTGTARAVS